MPTKNVNTNTNTNINKININIPKPAKPRQKSMGQAEKELASLEMNDSMYQPRAYTTDVPINPSMFGFSHLPVNRESIDITREEPIVTAPTMEAPPAMETAPVAPAVAVRSRKPKGLKKSIKPVAATPYDSGSNYYSDTGYVSDQRGFAGYIENPMVTQMYEKVKSDFPARERYLSAAKTPGYIQSPLDLQLALKKPSSSASPTVAKMNKDYIPPTGSPYYSEVSAGEQSRRDNPYGRKSPAEKPEKPVKAGRPKMTEEQKLVKKQMKENIAADQAAIKQIAAKEKEMKKAEAQAAKAEKKTLRGGR